MKYKKNCDVLVVGGGLTGLAAASRLSDISRGTLDIVVLEDGPSHSNQHFDLPNNGPSALERWCFPAHDPFARSFTSSNENWSQTTRHVLGGRGMYWGTVLCQIDFQEFGEDVESLEWLNRAQLYGHDGRYERVRSYLLRHRFFDEGRVRAKNFGLRRMDDLGYISSTRALRLDGQESRPFASTEFFSEDREIASQNVTLITGASVARIQREAAGSFSVGYAQGDDAKDLSARRVILAAGGTQNARLYSSLQGGVNRYNLTDHLVVGNAFVCDEYIADEQLAITCRDLLLIRETSKTQGFNMFASATATASGRLVLDVWAMGEKDHSQPGSLTVDGRTAQLDTLIDIEIKISDLRKLELMRDQAEVTLSALREDFDVQHLSTTGREIATDTIAAMRLAHFGKISDPTIFAYRSQLGTVDHEGCIFKQGVHIDELGASIQFPECFITGPSAFARMGSANPSWTSLALAFGVAERIACSI